MTDAPRTRCLLSGCAGAEMEGPQRVSDLAGADEIRLVWRNELGGRTFRAQGAAGQRFIKWQPTAGLSAARLGDVDLVREAEKLRWADRYVPVPRVIDCGVGPDGSWLVTDGIEATTPEPDRLVVCHGDPCVPNTLLDSAGRFAAHVDLARLGVADRWADLAIATASISWDKLPAPCAPARRRVSVRR